jgi:hypothetical protein
VATAYSLNSNPKLLIVQNVGLSLAFVFVIVSNLVKVNEGTDKKKLQVYIPNNCEITTKTVFGTVNRPLQI